MIDFILQPFQFPFTQIPFLIMAVLAVPTAILSCFLVLKGWSLMGDAISHAVLPGVVLAYAAGIPLIAGAFIAAMICAVGTGYLAETSRIKRDTVMGVVFSGMFGLGLVLFHWIPSDQHLDHILFGNVYGVDWAEFWTTTVIAGVVTAALVIFRNGLLLHAFDPIQTRALGLPAQALHYGLLVLLSLTIVTTLSSVGIILTIGLLIAPGAIAFLLTKRFFTMLITAVVVTEVAAIGGVWLSFHLGSDTAPTIILILLAIFLVAFAATLMRRGKAAPVDSAASRTS